MCFDVQGNVYPTTMRQGEYIEFLLNTYEGSQHNTFSLSNSY